MTDSLFIEQEAHALAMEMANATFMAALQGRPAGDRLIWRGNHMPLAEGPTIQREYLRADAHRAAKAQIDARRVYRGTCTRCGANTAKGCPHVS